MTLVEILIAFTIVTLTLLGLSLALTKTTKAVFSSKQEAVASRLAQLIHAKLLQMDFDQIFPVDSNNKNPTRTPSPLYYDPQTNPVEYNFWAPWTSVVMTTRTLTILGQIEQEVRSAGFTRFSITVRYMRRDSSDVDNQQNVSDITFFARYYGSSLNQVFTVTPSINAPDNNDPNIAFRDRNGDSDFWDVVGGLPETPHTDMKLLTITIYNANRVIAIKHGDLITRQQFSGRAGTTTESPLKLIWKIPYQNLWAVNSTVFYQRDTYAKQNALDVPFYYQSQLDTARAPKTSGNTATQADHHASDVIRNFHVEGESEPGATIEIEYSGLGVAWGAAVKDTCVVASNGQFSCDAPNTSNYIQINPCFFGACYGAGAYSFSVRMRAQSQQGLYSPYVMRSYIVDYFPPVIDNFRPSTTTAIVHTRQPVIACRFGDPGQDGVSGANTWLYNLWYSTDSGSTWSPPFRWDNNMWRYPYPDGLYWSGTYVLSNDYAWTSVPANRRGLPFVFNNGQLVTVRAEMCDVATYKATTSWTFQISVDESDVTGPTIDVSTSSGLNLSKSVLPPAARNSHLPPMAGWRRLAVLDDPESGIDWGSLSYTWHGPYGSSKTYHAGVLTGFQTLQYSGYGCSATGGGCTFDPYNSAFGLPIASMSTGTYHIGLSVQNWAVPPVVTTVTWTFDIVP